MIIFPNGLSISSMVISTALGHFGRGFFPYLLFPNYRKLVSTVKREKVSVITKSSTRFSYMGNFIRKDPRTWKYVQRLPNMGMLNSHGLTNDGVEKCAEQIAISRKKGFNVIPSFYPENKDEEIAIRETLEAVELFSFHFGTEKWILELNFSCPNFEGIIAGNTYMASECVAEVKKRHPNIIVIAKTSIVHAYHFYTMLEDAGADCIHAINSIPYKALYNSASPFENISGGGVSGGPAFARAFFRVREVPKYTSLPLILGCGVIDQRNAETYFQVGKRFKRPVSVSMCTLPARAPKQARELILKFGN